MEFTPGRARLLRVGATLVLLGVFSFVAFPLVLDHLADIDETLEEVTSAQDDEVVPQGCDFVADVAECPEPDPSLPAGIVAALRGRASEILAR